MCPLILQATTEEHTITILHYTLTAHGLLSVYCRVRLLLSVSRISMEITHHTHNSPPIALPFDELLNVAFMCYILLQGMRQTQSPAIVRAWKYKVKFNKLDSTRLRMDDMYRISSMCGGVPSECDGDASRTSGRSSHFNDLTPRPRNSPTV